MRSDWFLPICTGAERLKDESGRKAHPTQKPEALLTRVLLAASNAGDLVLDPFFGSGTTGVAARRLRPLVHRHRARSALTPKRRASGSMRSSRLPEAALAIAPTRRSEPRVAFASVVEAGLARPGERLVDAGAPPCGALVRADGALAAGPAIGSIHKIGALVQGLPACNGWTFWHVERAGRLTPIDELRAAMPEGPAVAGGQALRQRADLVDRADRWPGGERAVGAHQRAMAARARRRSRSPGRDQSGFDDAGEGDARLAAARRRQRERLGGQRLDRGDARARRVGVSRNRARGR